MAWLHPPVLGCRYSFLHLPCARCGHSLCVYRDVLVLFGGFDGRKWLNDLHFLNTAVMVWDQPKACGLSPVPRQYHAAVVVADAMFIYGGFSGSSWLGDLHTLNFLTLRWDAVPLAAPLPAKEGHTMEAVGDVLYCFGGWDGAAVSDLHTFDTKTRKWSLVECESGPARCGHSMTAVGSALYVYGGFDGESWTSTLYTFDTVRAQWTKCATRGCQTPRGYHSAVLVNQYILMFGGYNGQFILGDLVALDTACLSWSSPDPCFGRLPLARNAHSMALVGSELYLFGGYNGNRDVDNLDVLETAAFSSLREDMRTMMRMKQWKDIVLRADNSEAEVHAVILKARAPLLHAHMSPSGEVRLPNCSPHLLQLFVEFLYCDLSREQVAEHQQELLALASMCEIASLRALCTSPESLLTNELAAMISFQDLSDLTLIIENESFFVHKCVLCARCPYFKALFASGMSESQSASVTLHDISPRALRLVLEWMYFDKFDPLVAGRPLETAFAVEVLAAANQLLLQSVLRMTEIVLQQQLSPDNAVPLYEVAFILNAERLKCYCLNLILHREFAQLSPQALEEITAILPTRMRRQTSHASNFHCDMSMVRWEREEDPGSGLFVHSLKPGPPLQVKPHNPSSSPVDLPGDPLQNSIPGAEHPLSRRQDLNIFGVRASQCQQLKYKRREDEGKRTLSSGYFLRRKTLVRHKSQTSRQVETRPSFLVKGQNSRGHLHTAESRSPPRQRR